MRLLGLDPPLPKPSPAALYLVRSTLDRERAHDGELAATEFDDFLAALAAAVPRENERLAREGIDAGLRAESLADVGRKVRAYGDMGIRGWLVELVRGDVITLGRLQFERSPGALGHAIHIPELGPLDPVSVDDSLARAHRMFGTDAVFCCTSWLLDPRLLDLGSESNIVRFQQRFRIVDAGTEGHDPSEADDSVAKFVFGRPLSEVLGSAVTPVSSLQRLAADVLRSGGHWTEPVGVLASAG